MINSQFLVITLVNTTSLPVYFLQTISQNPRDTTWRSQQFKFIKKTTSKHVLLFDTNFLFVPFEFRVEIKSEIQGAQEQTLDQKPVGAVADTLVQPLRPRLGLAGLHRASIEREWEADLPAVVAVARVAAAEAFALQVVRGDVEHAAVAEMTPIKWLRR